MSYTIVGTRPYSQVPFEIKVPTARIALEEVVRARERGAVRTVRDPRGQMVDDDDLRWLAETEADPG